MLTAMIVGDEPKEQEAQTSFWGQMAAKAAKPFLTALEKEVGDRYQDAEVVVSIRRDGGAAGQREQPQVGPQARARQSSRYDEERNTFLEQYRQDMEA